LALNFAGDQVTGELRPLLGASGVPIKVSGTNPSEGRLELAFEGPDGTVKRAFKKHADKWRIEWVAEAKDPDAPRLLFYRYTDGAFSEAALTFTEGECATPYGYVELIFPDSTTEEQAAAFFKSHPELAALPTSTSSWKGDKLKKTRAPMAISFRNVLREFRTGKYGSIDIEVPVGSEPYVVQLLRQSGLAIADLDQGGCGDLERDYFALEDPTLFPSGSVSWPKLESYFETALKNFAGEDADGKKWNYRIGQARVVEIRLPTKPTSYHVKMYVASEITRKVPGWWDSFALTLEPFQERTSQQSRIAVVVTVERLKSSKRSWFNASPPDDSYFTKEQGGPEEGEITKAICRFFDRRDTR